MKGWQNIGLHLMVYGVAFAMLQPQTGDFFWALGLGCVLVWISVVDTELLEIPDAAAAALALLGGARLVLVPGLPTDDHLLGGVLWPLLLWLVGAVYAWFRGWQGLGFGDVKLMFGIGIWVGFHATILVLLAASLAGILALLSLSAMRRVAFRKIGTSAIAFGPFLCLSAWVIWLGEQG